MMVLTIPSTLKPPNKLTPLPIPSFKNIGLEKRIEPNAKAERQKSLLAKRDAAYWGYDIGIYMKMHCMMI